MSDVLHTDVIIIGAGLAGLTAAWHLPEQAVAILRPAADKPASRLARGGIAAAVGEDDEPTRHVEDTIAAGAGLVDPDIASVVACDGVERMIDLFELSIEFDRDDQGRLQLGREAMHSRNRIVHAAGDRTGQCVTEAVYRQLAARRSLSFVDGRAVELIVADDQVRGVIYFGEGDAPRALLAPTTILATGGAASLFSKTTNPAGSRGEGIAMAARAGATLADLEFVQFHPTALACDAVRSPLLSEAIRGQGATLIDERGRAVMADHPHGDLAGRDVVSRALWRRIKDDIGVFLDVRDVTDFAESFPAARAACKRHGFEPSSDPLPVTPAAHYHMGGVATDSRGQTSLDGLWAVGEVASTGAHGANRLASNSLLEAMVFGARAAGSSSVPGRRPYRLPLDKLRALETLWARANHSSSDSEELYERLSQLMWKNVGIERTRRGLMETIEALNSMIDDLDRFDPTGLSVEAARAIADAALGRTESRGAHYRVDYPSTNEALRRRYFV